MVDQVRPGTTDPLLPIPPAPFPYLWFSGRMVPWQEATVHITAVGWPAIGAVFEGIRGYWNAEQGRLHVFRLQDHLRRLERSTALQRARCAFSSAELAAAVIELARSNAVDRDIYIQPLAFSPGATSGSRGARDQAVEIVITMRPEASTLPDGATLTAGVSSWQRIDERVLPPRVKALANYANSRLGANEAQRHGYNVPIFLNQAGKVSESSGSCVLLVRDGVLVTPPATASILESITRHTVLELARSALDVPMQERDVDRTELYLADEVFLCGTQMELSPVVAVDGYKIGDGEAGPVTSRLMRLYVDVVRGREPRHAGWLTTV